MCVYERGGRMWGLLSVDPIACLPCCCCCKPPQPSTDQWLIPCTRPRACMLAAACLGQRRGRPLVRFAQKVDHRVGEVLWLLLLRAR